MHTGTRSGFRRSSFKRRRAPSGCYSANVSMGLSAQKHLLCLGEAGSQVHCDAVPMMDWGGEAGGRRWVVL